jgi:hypothetical protein
MNIDVAELKEISKFELRNHVGGQLPQPVAQMPTPVPSADGGQILPLPPGNNEAAGLFGGFSQGPPLPPPNPFPPCPDPYPPAQYPVAPFSAQSPSAQ